MFKRVCVGLVATMLVVTGGVVAVADEAERPVEVAQDELALALVTEIPLELAAGVAEYEYQPSPEAARLSLSAEEPETLVVPEVFAEVVPDVFVAEPVYEVDQPEAGEALEMSVIDYEDRVATPAMMADEVFQTVAVTWPMGLEYAPELKARVQHLDGQWGEWFELEDDGAAPDYGSIEGIDVRAGSDPFFIGEAMAVQVATMNAAAEMQVEDVLLVLIGDGEEFSAPETATPLAATSTSTSPRNRPPTYTPRSAWGAAPPQCEFNPSPARLRGAIVHHTASAIVVATPAQALTHVRNIQAFHMNARGWCDIAYNFLVDRFGNLIEGRAGSMTQNIVGVHAGGFNTGTVGVSVLGDHTSVAISNAAVETIGRLLGWRLGSNGLNPQGFINFETIGGQNSRFPAGARPRLNTIFAHRDVSHTACPGDIGFTQMNAIRAAAARHLPTIQFQESFTFTGRGFGHGRGMGQWGALGYAVDHGWNTGQILNHFYQPASLATDAGNPQVSIELQALAGRETIVVAPALSVNGSATGTSAVRLVRNGNRLDWYAGNGCAGPWTRRGTVNSGATVSLNATTTNPREMLGVCQPGSNDRIVYRGHIEVVVQNNRQFTFSVLDVQSYLQGVVPREMPASWGDLGGGRGQQALRAQAVAARSFALSLPNRTSGATTCDTTDCQVYGGAGIFVGGNGTPGSGTWTAREDARTNAAVTGTNGWVMRMPNGAIARTEYSASTGGHSAPGGPFTPVVDLGDSITNNPNHSWTVTFSNAELQQALGVGPINGIRVLDRNGVGADGGRVAQLEITSGGVPRTMTGPQFRTAVGTVRLRSDWFAVVNEGTLNDIVDGAGVPACDATGLPQTFRDKPPGTTFHCHVEWLHAQGIATGWPDGTFRPATSIERQAMAAFLYRMAGSPAFTPPVSPSYSDVSRSHPFFLEIEWLNASGVSTGWDDGTFRPVASIERQAMAAFLYRMADSPTFTPPTNPSFTDVPRSHPFFLEIEWLNASGISTGWNDGTFRPGALVERQAMAAFLFRAANLGFL